VPKLLGIIRTIVFIIWVLKNLLSLFKSDPPLRVVTKLFTLFLIEFKSHNKSITVIPFKSII
ncbi:MAG: hypothetical protein DRP54_07105, partial [Spirochaetes bacterium]